MVGLVCLVHLVYLIGLVGRNENRFIWFAWFVSFIGLADRKTKETRTPDERKNQKNQTDLRDQTNQRDEQDWRSARRDLSRERREVVVAIVSITVENPCELHHLGLLVDRIDNAIFALCNMKPGETPVGEVRELFRVRRTRRATKTQDFEKGLAKALRICMPEIFMCVEDCI